MPVPWYIDRLLEACPPVILVLLALCLISLAGCGERASTYDPDKGRWVDTEGYRRDQTNREIDLAAAAPAEPPAAAQNRFKREA